MFKNEFDQCDCGLGSISLSRKKCLKLNIKITCLSINISVGLLASQMVQLNKFK